MRESDGEVVEGTIVERTVSVSRAPKYRVRYDDGDAELLVGANSLYVSSFAEGRDGELYVLTFQGEVHALRTR